MIHGIFHEGSGLGNQLHRYVATRSLAKAKGEEFGMVAPDLFKGKDFMDLDMGDAVTDYTVEYPAGKVVPTPDLNILEGEFQNELIWKNNIDEVRGWLRLRESELFPMNFTDEHCVIAFRGGEYKYFPELFLPQEYWDMAIVIMKEKGVKRFFVVTDDVEEARKFFPDFQITHEIRNDWYAINQASNLILSNSSFGILPAWLGNAKEIIAPKYWARYNKRHWINPDNNYSRFTYIHHEEDSR